MILKLLISLLVPSAYHLEASRATMEEDWQSLRILTELPGSTVYNSSRLFPIFLGPGPWFVNWVAASGESGRQSFQKHWSGRGVQRRRTKQFWCGVKGGGTGNTSRRNPDGKQTRQGGPRPSNVDGSAAMKHSQGTGSSLSVSRDQNFPLGTEHLETV